MHNEIQSLQHGRMVGMVKTPNQDLNEQSQKMSLGTVSMTEANSYSPIQEENDHHQSISHHNGATIPSKLYIKTSSERSKTTTTSPRPILSPPRDLYISNSLPLPSILQLIAGEGYPNASILIDRAITDPITDCPNLARVSIVSNTGYRMALVSDNLRVPCKQGILLNATLLVNQDNSNFPTILWTGHLVYQFYSYRLTESGNVTPQSHLPNLTPFTSPSTLADRNAMGRLPGSLPPCQSFETTAGAMLILSDTCLHSAAAITTDINDAITAANDAHSVIEISDDEAPGPSKGNEAPQNVFFNHMQSIVSDSKPLFQPTDSH